MERISLIMRQVAEGMVFMRTRCIVHRNLKAASVLMTSQVQAKISNFEYSKQLNENREYCEFEERESFLRWIVPECLHSYKFYYKSDAFSFGITLWEATSYGARPYGCATDEAIRIYKLNGVNLSEPKLCPPKMYHLMMSCWQQDLNNRLEFEDIVDVLSDPDNYASTVALARDARLCPIQTARSLADQSENALSATKIIINECKMTKSLNLKAACQK